MICPECGSTTINKNGHTYYGKQNHKCKKCDRQFVTSNEDEKKTEERLEIIKKMLLERISLRGICRVMDVPLTWLLYFFTEITDNIPEDLAIVKPEKSKLTLQLDEMWSFVGRKKNKKWIWLAIDVASGQIVGFHVGGRKRKDAKKLWASLPGVYRQCAVCYTDYWEAYEKVIPQNRHKAVGKKSGQTNRIERFNCTLRQRISRLVRETLSFSKKMENHIRAIKYFIWDYNLLKSVDVKTIEKHMYSKG